MTLEPDYSLEEVAEALGMSPKWVRRQVQGGAEHQRYGHKIRFTEAQVDRLRATHTKQPVAQGVTTGRKRKTS